MNAASEIFHLLKFHNHNFVRIYFILHACYMSPHLILFYFYCNCDATCRQHCPGLSATSFPSEVKKSLANLTTANLERLTTSPSQNVFMKDLLL
jgi:hypothetical protein